MPPTTPPTTGGPVGSGSVPAGANPATPTPVTVGSGGGAPRVEIRSVSAQFAPSVDACLVTYGITGTATGARLQIRAGGTLLAEVPGAPFATGDNQARWDGRATTGTRAWQGPGTYEVKVVLASASGNVESAPRQTKVVVDSVVVTGDGPTSAHPDRIYRPDAGGDNTDPVDVTALVKLKNAAGAGVATEVPLRVEWQVEVPSGWTNCPVANGGRDRTSGTFWQAASGYASTISGGTATGDTKTTGADKGKHKIRFVGTTIGGDKWKPMARVSNGAGGSPANVEGRRGHSFEVWRKVRYERAYQISGGLSIASICGASSLQPLLDPVFIEYTLGTVHPMSRSGEYLAPLTPPTDDQRPRTGAVSAFGGPGASGTLTIRGKVRAADGTRDHTESHPLRGEDTVSFSTQWQVITAITLSAAQAEGVVIEHGDSGESVTIEGGQTAAPADADGRVLKFDTNARLQPLAQAWHNANKAAWDAALTALRPSGVSGFFLVGARLLHPKRHGSTPTHFYDGYVGSSIFIRVEAEQVHPDAVWHAIDGAALQDGTSVLFSNLAGSDTYRRAVACHEIAHATLDSLRSGRTFGTGDHCSNGSCVMNANSQQGDFCTSQNSLQRAKGWRI